MNITSTLTLKTIPQPNEKPAVTRSKLVVKSGLKAGRHLYPNY